MRSHGAYLLAVHRGRSEVNVCQDDIVGLVVCGWVSVAILLCSAVLGGGL